MQDAQRQQEMGAQEALKQKYISMFMDMGKQDHARLIEGGMAPGDAYRQFMADRAAGAAKPMEVNGQLVDPTTYQVLATIAPRIAKSRHRTFRTISSMPNRSAPLAGRHCPMASSNSRLPALAHPIST